MFAVVILNRYPVPVPLSSKLNKFGCPDDVKLKVEVLLAIDSPKLAAGFVIEDQLVITSRLQVVKPREFVVIFFPLQFRAPIFRSEVTANDWDIPTFPVTSNLYEVVVNPIPTFPWTISPSVGVVRLKLEPMLTPPLTYRVEFATDAPIPILPPPGCRVSGRGVVLPIPAL